MPPAELEQAKVRLALAKNDLSRVRKTSIKPKPSPAEEYDARQKAAARSDRRRRMRPLRNVDSAKLESELYRSACADQTAASAAKWMSVGNLVNGMRRGSHETGDVWFRPIRCMCMSMSDEQALIEIPSRCAKAAMAEPISTAWRLQLALADETGFPAYEATLGLHGAPTADAGHRHGERCAGCLPIRMNC
jgi:hypothetical protein